MISPTYGIGTSGIRISQSRKFQVKNDSDPLVFIHLVFVLECMGVISQV